MKTPQDIKEEFKDLRHHARNLSDLMDTRVGYENRWYAKICEQEGEAIGRRNPIYLNALYEMPLPNGEYTQSEYTAGRKTSVWYGLHSSEYLQEKHLIAKMKIAFSGEHMEAFLAQPGVGDKLIARLAGEIGHPVLTVPAKWVDAPEGSDEKRVLEEGEMFARTVGQLWSYIGMGDPSRRPKVGMSQEDAMACGSRNAKKFAYLLADAAMKKTGGVDKTGKDMPRSPYRDLYEITKGYYTANRPDWTPGHCNNATLRKVAKTIVKDFWIAARNDLIDQGILVVEEEQRVIAQAA